MAGFDKQNVLDDLRKIEKLENERSSFKSRLDKFRKIYADLEKAEKEVLSPNLLTKEEEEEIINKVNSENKFFDKTEDNKAVQGGCGCILFVPLLVCIIYTIVKCVTKGLSSGTPPLIISILIGIVSIILICRGFKTDPIVKQKKELHEESNKKLAEQIINEENYKRKNKKHEIHGSLDEIRSNMQNIDEDIDEINAHLNSIDKEIVQLYEQNSIPEKYRNKNDRNILMRLLLHTDPKSLDELLRKTSNEKLLEKEQEREQEERNRILVAASASNIADMLSNSRKRSLDEYDRKKTRDDISSIEKNLDDINRKLK